MSRIHIRLKKKTNQTASLSLLYTLDMGTEKGRLVALLSFSAAPLLATQLVCSVTVVLSTCFCVESTGQGDCMACRSPCSRMRSVLLRSRPRSESRIMTSSPGRARNSTRVCSSETVVLSPSLSLLRVEVVVLNMGIELVLPVDLPIELDRSDCESCLIRVTLESR